MYIFLHARPCSIIVASALMLANQVEMHSTLIFPFFLSFCWTKEKLLLPVFCVHCCCSLLVYYIRCSIGCYGAQKASDATKTINLIICVSVVLKSVCNGKFISLLDLRRSYQIAIKMLKFSASRRLFQTLMDMMQIISLSSSLLVVVYDYASCGKSS